MDEVNQSRKWRPEIVGLRAIAVIPVLAFHAGIAGFSGGFLGVDIFFTISGFLITQILLNELDTGTFRFSSFYSRRARRILPALYSVIIISIFCAWFLLPPEEMKIFVDSIVSVVLFLSNMFFWIEADYFSPNAQLYPLLHTWSLAIEEQYYLFFPLLLVYVIPRSNRKTILFILAACIVSFLGCLFISLFNPSLSFYSLPTRAFELGLGSLTAAYLNGRQVTSNNVFSSLGLLIILVSYAVFDESFRMPWMNLCVTVSTVLILVYGNDTKVFVTRILSLRVFAWLGTVSYSLYLIHQPLFAFVHIQWSNVSPIMLVVIAIILGGLHWRVVELPFRDRNFIPNTRLMGLLVFVSIALLLFGFLGNSKNGFFSQRFSQSDQEYLRVLIEDHGAYVRKRFNGYSSNGFKEDNEKPNILIIGDSFAQDFVNILFESALLDLVDVRVKYVSGRCGNLFIQMDVKLQHILNQDKAKCAENYDILRDNDLAENIKLASHVFLVSSWKKWQLSYLNTNIDYLTKSYGEKFTVVGRKDFPNFSIFDVLGTTVEERAKFQLPLSKEEIEINTNMKNLLGAYFLDIQSESCGGSVEKCRPFNQDGKLKSADGVHLTEAGAAFVAERIASAIWKILFKI